MQNCFFYYLWDDVIKVLYVTLHDNFLPPCVVKMTNWKGDNCKRDILDY